MIRGCFRHFDGVGPAAVARLRQAGVRDWQALLAAGDSLPLGPARRTRVLAQAQESLAARERGDIGFFCRSFPAAEHWRILSTFLDRAAFFDLETDGLSVDARITVAALHLGGRTESFVRGENLEDLLDRLCGVDLLVTYNGATFDVPKVLRHFHIPELPCPHVDLRWVCHHAGLSGGLKEVERRVGLSRPSDLRGMDGADAVLLWNAWEYGRRRESRDLLVRYCRADVASMPAVTAEAMRRMAGPDESGRAGRGGSHG